MPRSKRPRPGSDAPTAPFWMATFSDMATLLLAFFVMIVAMSEVEVKKFEEALSYFSGQTGILQASEVVRSATPATALPAAQAVVDDQRYDSLLARLEREGLTEVVQVNLTQRGVHISIADSIMFASGEAALLPAAAHALGAVAGVVESDVQGVIVEGHTDDVPIRTARFPSNWELSGARAAAVVRFFLARDDALSPDRYQASGYGEFRPRAPNATPEGRAQNRRVEILLSTAPWPTPLPAPLPTPLPLPTPRP